MSAQWTAMVRADAPGGHPPLVQPVGMSARLELGRYFKGIRLRAEAMGKWTTMELATDRSEDVLVTLRDGNGGKWTCLIPMREIRWRLGIAEPDAVHPMSPLDAR